MWSTENVSGGKDLGQCGLYYAVVHDCYRHEIRPAEAVHMDIHSPKKTALRYVRGCEQSQYKFLLVNYSDTSMEFEHFQRPHLDLVAASTAVCHRCRQCTLLKLQEMCSTKQFCSYTIKSCCPFGNNFVMKTEYYLKFVTVMQNHC